MTIVSSVTGDACARTRTPKRASSVNNARQLTSGSSHTLVQGMMQLRIDGYSAAGHSEVMYSGDQRWPVPYTMMLISLLSGGLWFAIIGAVRWLLG